MQISNLQTVLKSDINFSKYARFEMKEVKIEEP